MLLVLAALQAAAVASSPAAPTAATAVPPPAIVVTGHRLADYAAAVDACVVAHCPPRQDIVAAIRYAEAQFRSGDYHGARATLAKAVARDKGAAAAEPLAVSQLYLAQANVATHFGEQREVAAATVASARVADDFLAAGDRDRLFADLRLADWRLDRQHEETERNPRIADAAYVRVAAAARAAGQADIAAAADLHRAWAMHARHDDAAARPLLAAIVGDPALQVRPYRLAARILTARIAKANGDAHAIDAVIAGLRAEPDGAPPVLVFSPPLPQPTDPVYRDDPIGVTFDTITRPSDALPLHWVDIGFSIRADGGVDDPEVLRGSPDAGWARPLVAMIAARRYSPTAGHADAPGHYRIERYTLTADFQTPTGSLIRRRVSRPRFEQLDLTDAAPRSAG